MFPFVYSQRESVSPLDKEDKIQKNQKAR